MTNIRKAIKYKENNDTSSILKKLIIPKHLFRSVQNKETTKLFKTYHDQLIDMQNQNLSIFTNILQSLSLNINSDNTNTLKADE